MREFARDIFINELVELEKIKGHTRIELTSVATGEKKIIEHDNSFQAGVLSRQLRSLGRYINSPWQNSDWDSARRWVSLCGGILLFRDTIDNSGGEVEYMPPSNKMIANGSYNFTNAGTPAELGTYNPVESVDGNNQKVIVYDWGTSQGNGTIGCVCLTSNVGGLIGYGNSSGDFIPQNNESVLNSDSWQTWQARDAIPYDNYQFRFTVDNTAKTLKVERITSAITTESIFEKLVESTITISYSSAVDTQGDRYRAVYLGSGKFAIFGCARSVSGQASVTKVIPNGTSYTFLIYDAADNSVTVKTLSNDSGYQLLLSTGNYIFEGCANENKLLFPVGEPGPSNNVVTGFVEFSMSTGQSIQYIAAPGDIGHNADKYWTCHCITDAIYSYGNWIISGTNGTCYPANGAFSGTFHKDYDTLLYTGGQPTTTGVDGMTRAMTKNPIYLATINNLDAPVTKDSTQTMKVIYTLTRA